jgi:hypothetical protein
MDEASSMKRAKTMYLNLNSSSRNNHKWEDYLFSEIEITTIEINR